MSNRRPNTLILHNVTAIRTVRPVPENVVRIWGSTDEDVVVSLHKRDALMHIALADSTTTNVRNVLQYAYGNGIQYFKSVVDSDTEPFVNESNAMVYLRPWTFAIDMKKLRAIVRAWKANEGGAYDLTVLFDGNYKEIGLLHDLAHILGCSTDKMPGMGTEDLSIYLARWGGMPGAEKFAYPYNIKL
jgi:hypothetical protein